MKLTSHEFRVFDPAAIGHKAIVTAATIHVPVATMNTDNYTKLLQDWDKENELKFHYLKTEVISRTIAINAETFESDQV